MANFSQILAVPELSGQILKFAGDEHQIGSFLLCSKLLSSVFTDTQVTAQWLLNCKYGPDAVAFAAETLCSVPVTRWLLKHGPDCKLPDAKLLKLAAKTNDTQLAREVLTAGGDSLSTDDKCIALGTAAANHSLDVIKLLVKAGTPMIHQDSDKKSALHVAAGQGDVEVLKLLVRLGVDLEEDEPDPMEKSTVLHLAVNSGNTAAVKFLLKQDACTADTEPDQDNFRALDRAVIANRMDMVKLLLKHGGLHHIEHDGDAPSLCIATWFGREEAARLILEQLSDDPQAADRPDNYGLMRPLVDAAWHGGLGLLRLLLSRGAHADYTNSSGHTALMMAAGRGHLDAVRLLLDHGASINLPEDARRGRCGTPLMAAAWGNHVDVMRELLARGAETGLQDMYGWTALMAAAAAGHVEATSVLLEAGADTSLQSKTVPSNVPAIRNAQGGLTAMDLAAAAHHSEVVQLLLKAGASPCPQPPAHVFQPKNGFRLDLSDDILMDRNPEKYLPGPRLDEAVGPPWAKRAVNTAVHDDDEDDGDEGDEGSDSDGDDEEGRSAKEGDQGKEGKVEEGGDDDDDDDD